MFNPTRIVRDIVTDRSGSIAPIVVIGLLILAGATGVGIDSFRMQSVDQSLQHLVDASCERIQRADFVTYPTNKDLQTGMERWVESAKKGTAASDAKMKISLSGNEFTVEASKLHQAGLTSLVGASDSLRKIQRACSRDTTIKTGKDACNIVAVDIDPSTQEEPYRIDDLKKQSKSSYNVFLYTVVDAKNGNKVKVRQEFRSDLSWTPPESSASGRFLIHSM